MTALRLQGCNFKTKKPGQSRVVAGKRLTGYFSLG